MSTHCQRFTNNLATAGAFLACVLWINEYQCAASFFRFATQDCDEAVPACITDTARQSAVLDHPFDAQAFRSNVAVPVNQITSDLVVHVPTGVSHLGVQGRNTLLCFLAGRATSLSARQLAASPAKLLELRFKHSAISERLPVTSRDELLKSNVDTNSLIGGCWFGLLNLDAEAGEPIVAFAENRAVLDFPVGKLPVPADANSPDVLEPELAIDDLASAPITGEGVRERVESVMTLKSWSAVLSTRLEVGEEFLVCFFEFPERLLGGAKIKLGEVLVGFPADLKPCRLFVVRPVRPSGFPAELHAIQAEVVKPAVRLKACRKLSLLIGVGEQSVFECLNQLFACLVSDVFANSRFDEVTYSSDVVTRQALRIRGILLFR